MVKAGNILLLAAAFFAFLPAGTAIAGTGHNVQAFVSQDASSCANQLVSTPLCEEIESQTCKETVELKEEPKTAPPAIVITEAKTEPAQISLSTTSITIMPSPPQQTENLNNPSNTAELNSERIFEMINQYRASQGLAPFEHDQTVCKLAQERSAELEAEINNGTIHSGLYGRDLPYWIFENAKVGSNEQDTFAWWINSPIHHRSIVSNYKFSCIKCAGNNCSQLFTSFSPK